jgi:hypothetical protein
MGRLERPPRDGWILVRPGEGIEFHEETPVSPHQAQLQAVVRQVRGAVLSASFDLENTLETAIATFFFPEALTTSTPALSAKREYFREMLLREMSFEKKMALAQKFTKNVLDKSHYKEFAATINKLRVLRNMMAHYPCWLEPKRKAGTNRVTGFRAFIAKGNELFEITSEQVEKWQALAHQAVQMAEALMKTLSSK